MAVELALCAPVLLAIVVLLVEGGRALAYGAAIEKGLRAGAMYVARAPLPIAPETAAAIDDLVKRGTVDAVGPYLVPGWDDPGATVTVTRLADYVTHGVAVPVFRVTASVPFAPILPYFPAFAISLSHEQAYVGR